MARPGRGGLGRDRPGGDGPGERGTGAAPRHTQRRDAAAAGAGLRPGRAVAAHGRGLGRVSGLADLSDTAVMKRLRRAAPWLGEVAGALLRRAAAVPPTPGPLPGRR